MSNSEKSAQPKAQAGGTREACKVAGEVGVLHSSVDLWESITHGEPREGTCPNAQKRSKGRGDGPQGLGMIFLRKRGLDSCFLVEVNGLAAALKALW